jgi:hypothetical protein
MFRLRKHRSQFERRGAVPDPHPDRRVVETDVEARQGLRGRPVLYVLIASGCLLGLYLVGMLLWSGASSPPAPAEGPRTVTTLPPIAPSSALNEKDPPAANPAYPVPAVPAAR